MSTLKLRYKELLIILVALKKWEMKYFYFR